MVNTSDDFKPSETFTEAEEGFEVDITQVGSDDELQLLAKSLGVSPENVILDDEGNVIRIIDDEGNVHDTDVDGEEGEGSEEGAGDTAIVDAVNDLDFVLRSTGLVGIEKIEIEEGVVKSIAELSREEQLNEIVSYVNNIKESIKEPDVTQILSKEEIDIVNYLRTEGKSLDTLLEDLQEKNPAAKVAKMTDEDLVRFSIAKNRPTYTPEEIEEEVRDIKDKNKLEREAKFYRSQYESTGKGASLEEITREQQAAAYKETVDQVNEVFAVSKKTGSIINGFDLNDEVRQRVLGLIVPPGLDKGDLSVNPPILDLFNSPEGIFELAYYKSEVPHIINAVLDYAKTHGKSEYERGRNEVLGKLPTKR